MRVFFYDESFEGLLSAVFDAYTLKRFPDLLLPADAALPLMATDEHRVETQEAKAGRVLRALEKKLSAYAFSGVLYAALADDAESALVLFRYIRKVFDSAASVEDDLADVDIKSLADLARKIGSEKERLLGFARFQKTAQGVYFSVMEPRYNVLPLMAGHFKERFADQQWVLYDARREYGIFFDGEECREMTMDRENLRGGGLNPTLLAEGEELIERMWQGYFSATAVAERTNPRLQARCLPRRFWKYLTEMRK